MKRPHAVYAGLVAVALALGLTLAVAGPPAHSKGKRPKSTVSSPVITEPVAPLPTTTLVQLGWSPNVDSIAGYVVYHGQQPDNTPNLASDLPVTSTAFNAQAPAVTYNATTDLGLTAGTSVCFRIRAYNDSRTMSAWSSAVCTTI